jgi:hypothetical protein
VFGIKYNHDHVINKCIQDIKSGVKVEENKANFLKAIESKTSETDFDKKTGEFIVNLFDFKCEAHSHRDDAENMLYKLCARHLVIIFNTFTNLTNKLKKDGIVDGFLESVLSVQGWEDFKKESGQLSLSNLKEGVGDFADLKEMKMKKSSIHTFVELLNKTTESGAQQL